MGNNSIKSVFLKGKIGQNVDLQKKRGVIFLMTNLALRALRP